MLGMETDGEHADKVCVKYSVIQLLQTWRRCETF